MKTIKSLRDLEHYGIRPLTGEADALSYRILCDLTAAGRQLVCEAYGLLPSGFAENWNSGAVASMMLGFDAWRQIGPIALVRDCHTVFAVHQEASKENPATGCRERVPEVFNSDIDCLVGIEKDEEFQPAQYEWDEEKQTYHCTKPAQLDGMNWPSCYGKIGRMFRTGNGPHVGTRNVHAMSGRTV